MTTSVAFPTAADPATYAAVHRVITAVVALDGAVGWLSVPDEAETGAWLDEHLAYAAAGRGGVALVSVDGVVEALGVWSRYHAPVVAQNAEIRKVMAHPDARGRGLGRVVVEALTEHAKEHGVEVLVLDARGNNHGAHALYERLGWRRCGYIPDFIAVGEHRWDRVFFAKRVSTPPDAVLHGSEPVGPGFSVRRDEPDET